MGSRFNHTFFWGFLLIAFYHGFLPAAEEIPPVGNTLFFLDAVQLAGEELAAPFEMAKIDSVCYRASQDSTLLDQLIHYQLQATLGKKSISLVSQDTIACSSVTVLIVSKEFQYGKSFKKGFLRKGRVERKTSIQLMCHWEIPGDEIRSGMIRKSVCDTIDLREIPLVEKNDLLSGAIVQPGATRWSWAEGILSAGILSTVIYLFYAIRSQ